MSLNPDPEFEYSPLLDPTKKKYAWWVMEFLTRKEFKFIMTKLAKLIYFKEIFLMTFNFFEYAQVLY